MTGSKTTPMASTPPRPRVTRSLPQWLDALAVASVVAAIVLLLLPTAPRPHPIVPVLSPLPAAHLSLPSDSSSAQIIAGNLFSATRRAPLVRFMPPGSGTDASPPSSVAASAAVADEGPRLFGIISQDGARRALLQLPGADSTPHLMSVDDRRGGYRVISIAPDRVVVVSSAGTRTVRLAPRAPSDSSEKHL